MDQNIRQYIKGKLINLYGEEIDIQETPNNIETKNANKPDRPIFSEDIDKIIIDTRKEFNLNETVLARSILDDGTIIIDHSSN